MPRIHSYQFGKMTINGIELTSDLIIFPTGKIMPDWRRTQGHFLKHADLEYILSRDPDLIIIGTGLSGQMRVDPDLIKILEQKDIDVIILKTGNAVDAYNQKRSLKLRIAACFHLTC